MSNYGESRRPFPKCCEAADKVGGVWWHDTSLTIGDMWPHVPGWTMTVWASVTSRSVAYGNVTFCPHCGTKLPEGP
jgi:hypothetical protein